MVERFTRVAEDQIHYEFTIDESDDVAQLVERRGPDDQDRGGPMYEYGCHEGNHDIRHIQEINRNLERMAAEAAAAEGK